MNTPSKTFNFRSDDRYLEKNITVDIWQQTILKVAKIVEKSFEMAEAGEFKLLQFDDNLNATAKEKAQKAWDDWAKRDAACTKAVALQKEWYKNR